MATRNNIGKTFYFSATLPATNDAAGFEALTWTRVENELTLPRLGVSNALIDVEHLAGFTEGVKGQGIGNDSEASFAIKGSALTTNQAALQALADSAGGVIAIKIGSGSGAGGALTTGDTVQYAQGIVHSYIENEINTTSHEGFTVGFRQNDLTVTATEPA